ncbi:MAG: translation initiation factor IF-3 [Phycisphaeraceae bacterium]
MTQEPHGDRAINRRFQPQVRDTGKRLRINEMIRISPIRLIDENNEQVGVIETIEAKRRAKEVGLDLVEVSPQSAPPVCRIMDYGKWKYQQKKKEQKARSHSKQSELKELRLRPQIDEHDLDIKTKRSREFLDEGHKVQFTIQFKGREMAHRELGIDLMRQVAGLLEDVSKVEQPPRSLGRRMTMTLVPERKQVQKPPKAEGSASPAAKESAPADKAPVAKAAPAAKAAPKPAPEAKESAPAKEPAAAAKAKPKKVEPAPST